MTQIIESTKEKEHVRKISIVISPTLWAEFDIAITKRFDYKKTRTEIIIELVKNFVSKNSAFLFPVNKWELGSDIIQDIKDECEHINKTVSEVYTEEARRTTMQVPMDLWDDFHIVAKRKLGLEVTINDVIVTLVKDYLDGLG